MFRSILIPATLIGLVLIPFFIPLDGPPRSPESVQAWPGQQLETSPFRLASAPINSQTPATGLAYQTQFNAAGPNQNPATSGMPAGLGSPVAQPSQWPPAGTGYPQGTHPGQTLIYDVQGNPIAAPAGQFLNANAAPPGVPDYGAAETFVLPGNAWGPDLDAAPMEFVPVLNFAEIFRFDVTPQWVQSRWDRVSSSPGEPGLQGLRTALVTGTNSWDLHGSLTYYFDGYQQCQRITFRGWAGDPTQLLTLLQQRFGFKQQAAMGPGLYLAQRGRRTVGGLLMKLPTVTYSENRRQQVGVLLEINRAGSNEELSDDFDSLVRGAQVTSQ